MSLKNGNGGFAEGMILSAIIGVITTFLSSITLIVKGLVDSLTSRSPGISDHDHPQASTDIEQGSP